MRYGNRKGQYMALEAVLSLGLSLIVAVAAITIFSDYRNSVMQEIGDRETSIIKSQVVTSIYNLKEADSGSYVVLDLPDIGDSEPRLALEDEVLEVSVKGEEKSVRIGNLSGINRLRGTATGNEVRIQKLEDDILLEVE
jgi:hypothetical protein